MSIDCNKMSQPRDPKLYERVKHKLYKKHPTHSAYRSGLLVQAYKKEYRKKYRSSRAYSGKKNKRSGLSRWYAEKWRNQRGGIGYQYKSDVYRPTQRITSRTPVTFSELSPQEINRARRIKRSGKRVSRFRKK
jgi:hypothetical protein